MNEIIKYKMSPDLIKPIDIDDIKKNLHNLEFNTIELDNGTIVNTEKRKCKICYTDSDNPILISQKSKKNIIFINPEYYNKNKEKIDQLLKYICGNIKNNNLNINGHDFINLDLIKEISKNSNLLELSLYGDYNNPYLLSQEAYNILKKSSITKVFTSGVEEELKDNYDELIRYNINKKIIGYYSFGDLKNKKNITISKVLSNEEIDNLKYLSDDLSINISFDDYDNILEAIIRLNSLNKKCKIKLESKNKSKLTEYILNHENFRGNIEISDGYNSSFPLESYLKYEKILYTAIYPALNHDMSPFEKYIYAYNVVKKFKAYKENETDKLSARNLYKVLSSDYMVCVGYTVMLKDLLAKLDIKSIELSLSVDSSYDNISIDEKNYVREGDGSNKNGHARLYVNIEDEKYGINGFYVADPTWDNNIKEDYYTYSVITDKEMTEQTRMIWLNNYRELYNISSVEEFYEKFKILSKRENMIKIIKIIIVDIKELDNANYIKLKKILSSFENGNTSLNNLLQQIANYLLSKVNKPIKGENIISAAMVVNDFVYNFTETESKKYRDHIIKINKDRYEKEFPTRYVIKDDGTREVYLEVINKFDIDNKNNRINSI